MPPADLDHPRPLSDAERAALLRELDQVADGPPSAKERRRARRAALETEILVNVGHADGNQSDLVILVRNISTTGLAFLHVGAIDKGQPCAVVVPSTDGTVIRVEGRVVRTSLVTEAIHEIAIEFEREIDLTRVVAHLGA